MASAQQTKPKWVDPDSTWDDDDTPKVIELMRPESEVDRFHNHEDMSPEAMAKAISDLKATVQSLDGRLAAAEEGASGATHAVKDLGSSMFKMGDALSKRVKQIEDSMVPEPEPEPVVEEAPSLFAPVAKPPVKEHRMRLTIGLAAVVAAIIAAVVLLQPQLTATHAAAPPQVLYAPTGS